MGPQIIVTGFQPFSVFPINSSWESAKVLYQQQNHISIKQLHVHHLIAHKEINSLLKSSKCNILLLSGLADYNFISLETRAFKPVELQFIEGPQLINGIWPWEKAIRSMLSLDIHAMASQDAGKYVCESVFWSALNFRRINGYPKFVGFMHVPVISQEWDTNRIAKAMEVTIEAALPFL
jgi:pyrrolidone-carboxylate peptidase